MTPLDIIMTLVDYLLNHNGSDLHFPPYGIPKARVQGLLEKPLEVAVKGEDVKDYLATLVGEGRRRKIEKDLKERGDTDFAVSVKEVRFRVNVAKSYANGYDGYYVVMRRISQNPPSLSSLGFPEKVEQGIWKRVIIPASEEKISGLLILVGETGSGKSTTLASIIREILQRGKVNVITLEDPIEYVHKDAKGQIIQRELATHFNDYTDGLKSALREDPNVLLVGEIRNAETLEEALRAAETGHLVLTTLHANDSVTAINRMSFMASEGERTFIRYRLSQVLIGIIAQKLIRTNAGRRELLCEALFFNRAIRNMMTDPEKDKALQSQIDLTPYSTSFEMTLFNMVVSGKISPEKAMNLAVRKDNMAKLLDKIEQGKDSPGFSETSAEFEI